MKHRKDLKVLQNWLEDEGIKVTGFELTRVHYRLYLERDGVRAFIVRPNSTSDNRRSLLNAVSDARRALRERAPA